MLDLAGLDERTSAALLDTVGRLATSIDGLTESILRLYRRHLPDYDVIPDDDILSSTRAMLEIVVAEVGSFRLPDAATLDRLEELALRRAAQGLPLETLAQGYQLGSREMLAVVDRVARDTGLSSELLLAIHDSSWHFANEAATVFARVQRDLTVERARFDAERRSAFARALLDGSLSVEQIHRDAVLFGLDPRARYVVVVARSSSHGRDNDLMRSLFPRAGAQSQTLYANFESDIVCICPAAPPAALGRAVAVGSAEPLETLGRSFDDAMLALETAEWFGLHGVVTLPMLGPKPLALGAARAGFHLEATHLEALASQGGGGADMADTARVFLDCDLSVAETAARLMVHPNTVRYRLNRFREVTGLDVRRTEHLVTTWWLLSRRAARERDHEIDRSPASAR